MMFAALFIIVCALMGGWFSRMCGGGRPHLPWGLEQWLYAAPYLFIFLGVWQGIPAYLLAVLGKRMGHGQYIALGRHRQPEAQDEKIDFLLRPFFGADMGGNYWRCVAGLALTGLAVTLPAGILFAWVVNPLSGAIIALSGVSKAPAYMLGTWLFDRGVWPRLQTWWPEVLTGAFGWGGLAAVKVFF